MKILYSRSLFSSLLSIAFGPLPVRQAHCITIAHCSLSNAYRLLPIAYCLLLIASLSSCKTDLEVNAPYKETPIVYGLLNQNDTVHFIKINKTFLGEADAYSMASVRDSSEYQNISATVEEWKNNSKIREWQLKDSVFTNKPSGDFYYPQQTVYYFTEPNLDIAAQYRLNISIDNGAKRISAKTELINTLADFTGGQQFVIPCSGQPGVNCIGFSSGSGKYIDKTFSFLSVKDGKRYQLEMNFYYEDILTDSSLVNRKITWTFQPPIIASSLNGGEELTVTIKGEDFYKELARQLIPLTNASILRRSFQKIEFSVYIAGDDLNTYLLANEPSTGIIQEKPEYTNIENGIGIFSARYSAKTGIKLLDNNSLDELVKGTHTSSLRFCRVNPSNGALICF